VNLGLVTTSYPRFHGDPAGNFVEEHARALRALGHEVAVIAAGDGTREPDERVIRIASPLFYGGGAPDAIERSFVRSLFAGASFTARMTAAVTSHSRSWDAIIAHWLAPSALASLPARKPLVAIAHGGDVHTLRAHGLLRSTLRALVARRAKLVFVHRELLALARTELPGLEAIVQPMGLDLDRFRTIPRIPTTPPTILVVARLVPVKGIDVMLTAFEELATPARLVIAGDGPSRTQLEARAKRLGSVEFVGAVDTEARDRLLGQASLVVVPSRILKTGRTEGTPLVALEALAAGVPVVASAVGGLIDLAAICHVPPDEPRALAAAIDRVLYEPPVASDLQASVASFGSLEVARRLLPELAT
jgi:glycosyltransferase involved in cell wall biosynthesis